MLLSANLHSASKTRPANDADFIILIWDKLRKRINGFPYFVSLPIGKNCNIIGDRTRTTQFTEPSSLSQFKLTFCAECNKSLLKRMIIWIFKHRFRIFQKNANPYTFKEFMLHLINILENSDQGLYGHIPHQKVDTWSLLQSKPNSHGCSHGSLKWLIRTQ